jgi:hypothetical protein
MELMAVSLGMVILLLAVVRKVTLLAVAAVVDF